MLELLIEASNEIYDNLKFERFAVAIDALHHLRAMNHKGPEGPLNIFEPKSWKLLQTNTMLILFQIPKQCHRIGRRKHIGMWGFRCGQFILPIQTRFFPESNEIKIKIHDKENAFDVRYVLCSC